MKRLFHTLTICTLTALLSIMTSCAPSLPDGVLSSKEMEDVLFDFHVAQALYETREFHSTESDACRHSGSADQCHLDDMEICGVHARSSPVQTG